jgi:hypothetical protein
MKAYAHVAGTLLPLSRRVATTGNEMSSANVGRIKFYAEMMRSGTIFPPVGVVFRKDGRFYVQDGFHRTLASALNNYKFIPTVANQNPWNNNFRFYMSDEEAYRINGRDDK